MHRDNKTVQQNIETMTISKGQDKYIHSMRQAKTIRGRDKKKDSNISRQQN